MRLLYDLFFLIFGILYIPSLLLKGGLHRDILQRFGFLPKDVLRQEKPVWIHAVSVGEALLAAKLAAGIKERFPGAPVVVSTTTRTGNAMIRKSAGRNSTDEGKSVVDAVFYYPLDIRPVVSRVVKILDPRLYVMVETELWPNLLEELYSKGVPVILANGRISDSSFGNYRKIKFITARILRCIDRFCMQTEKDAERIKKLGAPPERVSVTGNMKFDGKVSPVSGEISRERLGFASGDEIIVAGSTHFPEEPALIDIYRELRRERDGLKLILAPRHPERSPSVEAQIEKSGLKWRRFSTVIGNGISGENDIILVDTIGHLKDLYGVATLVFIGGSLARKGGQNPIEAARWGKAVVFGPHMFNFREVVEIFLENEAAVRVKDAAHLKKTLRELLEQPDRRDRIAANAGGVIEMNSGALERTIGRIEEYLV